MSARDDGGPAFPEPGLSGLPNGEFLYGRSGMTLRDYFAAAALQGWIASVPADQHIHEGAVAKRVYLMADAMLKARRS